MAALEQLRNRLAELVDLGAVEMLLGWDQLVMMPAEGAPGRAEQLATLARLTHERATATELGRGLDELEDEQAGDRGAQLDELDRDIVRIARRDWERARRVPEDLAAELSRASATGQESWQRARAEDDFAAFAPALRRNVELARDRAQCLVEEGQSPYEALLGDYDFGLRVADLQRVFEALAAQLPPLVGDARVHSPRRALAVPEDAQRAAVAGVLRRLGVDRASWRVDVSA